MIEFDESAEEVAQESESAPVQPEAQLILSTPVVPSLTAAETAQFELVQRMAKLFASSSFVPKTYQGNIPNCFIALDLARRLDLHALMVMQNLYIPPGGIPAWKSQFLVAMTNPLLEGSIDWEITDLEPKTLHAKAYVVREKGQGSTEEWEMPNLSVVAVGRRNGKVLRGPAATSTMAIGEGWIKNPKYQTMLEVMLRWRAAAFFTRFYFPERLCGFYTEDEVDQVTEKPVPIRIAKVDQNTKEEATRRFQELLMKAPEETVPAAPITDGGADSGATDKAVAPPAPVAQPGMLGRLCYLCEPLARARGMEVKRYLDALAEKVEHGATIASLDPEKLPKVEYALRRLLGGPVADAQMKSYNEALKNWEGE